MSWRSAMLAGCFAIAVVATARADEFVLASGGRLQGVVTDTAEVAHGKYVVQTPQGGIVTLSKDQVANVVRRLPQDAEYEQVRHQHPDTVAGQWALAEWCKEKRLTDQRKAHLERLIELDPNHKDARLALGYSRLSGQWRTTEEHMSSLGKVQYKGEWLYPQEIEIVEQRQQATQLRVEWTGNLKRWREWLGGDKEQAARANINDIKDPAALGPLSLAMEEEPRDDLRILYARAVARIGSIDGLMLLSKLALNDRSPEIRSICLDLVVANPQPIVVNHFIQQLRSNDNLVVNRAAAGLARFRDPRAVSPLIDALVTKHQVQVTYGSPGGGTSAMNTLGGSSFSTGSSTRIVDDVRNNQEVLNALLVLVGGRANYQFNVEAWKQWFAGEKKNAFADARRG